MVPTLTSARADGHGVDVHLSISAPDCRSTKRDAAPYRPTSMPTSWEAARNEARSMFRADIHINLLSSASGEMFPEDNRTI